MRLWIPVKTGESKTSDELYFLWITFSVFDGHGSQVVVDKTSLELVKGATIEYQQDLMKSAFVVVDNPQSESACGCGSSFAVKNFGKNPALD